MPLQTGIDVVDVARFESLLEKHGSDLTEEFFTPEERQHARESDRTALRYATYWSIREAAFKVGGGNLWDHYSVRPDGSSVELVVSEALYGSDRRRVPPRANWDSSVTRGDGEVVASVVASWSLPFT